MSFDALRVKVGRRPITVVELDLDSCTRVYGTAPCAAALGVTGSIKCFNTFKTCQDKANFNKGTKTYRFTSETSFLPVGEQVFPSITGVDIAPTQLDAQGLAVSASATISFRDFPHHDRGVDPYASERGVAAQGSFFGKLRARNPFMLNRPVRVMTGYIDDNRVIYTRTRSYFVDRMEGPDAGGNVKLVCKDLLRFADNEKKQVPIVSKGFLASSITDTASSLTLSPSGVGADYPASGRVRIGDELITYASKSGDTLNTLTRGVAGTVAAAHDADSTVQVCKVYTAAYPDDILYDLLVNFAGVNASFIPTADWLTERTTWLGSYTSTVTLSSPEGVRDVITEVLKATGSVMWWDEVAAKVRWKVITDAPPSGTVPLLDDANHFLEGTFTVRDLERERVSRVITYFGPISAIGGKDKKNFRSVSVLVDADSESDFAYGEEKTLELVNRWTASLPIAEDVASRYIERYKVTPREISFSLDAKDLELNTGDVVDIDTRLIQGDVGVNAPARFLITEAREGLIGSQISYKALQIDQEAGGITRLITRDDMPVWGSATADEKAFYMFISGDDGLMGDSSPAPLIS